MIYLGESCITLAANIHNHPLKEDRILFVDLDGCITSSSINNTFDFLKSYLYSCGTFGVIRHGLARLASGLLNLLVRNEVISRRVFLILCTFGLRKSKLFEYATKYWLKLIKNYMNGITLDLIRKLRGQGYSPVLLTSCIEIPACQIARSLRFESCIATRFRYLGDLIIGIREDTYAHLKFQVIRNRYGNNVLKHSAYIVDLESAKIEYPHKLFSKIYLISTKENERLRIYHYQA